MTKLQRQVRFTMPHGGESRPVFFTRPREREKKNNKNYLVPIISAAIHMHQRLSSVVGRLHCDHSEFSPKLRQRADTHAHTNARLSWTVRSCFIYMHIRTYSNLLAIIAVQIFNICGQLFLTYSWQRESTIIISRISILTYANHSKN